MPNKTTIAALVAMPATVAGLWSPLAQSVERIQDVLSAGESISEVRAEVTQMRQQVLEQSTGYKVMQQEQLQQGESVRRTEAKVDRLIEIMLERSQ